MNLSEELLFDFSLHMPRILVSGKTAIIDNVRKIAFINENSVVADCNGTFISVNGQRLIIDRLEEERMQITGTITSVEFYTGERA